jgi:hypothetical protein
MKAVIETLTRGVDCARFRHIFYSSEAFNREIMAAAKLKERVVREHVQLPDGKERSRLYIVPHVDLPAVIEKVVAGYVIAYEETSMYDPTSRTANVSIHTPGGDLLRVSAVNQWLPEPEGVRMRIELDVHVKLFGVAGLIERFVISETRKRYEVLERVMQQLVDTGAADDEPQAAAANS